MIRTTAFPLLLPIPLLVIAGLLAGPASSRAQVVVEGSAGFKTALEWTGFATPSTPAARRFLETLRSDLARSGWFSEAGPGSGEVILAGGCTEAGSALRAECRITERMTRRTRFGKSFTAPAEDARRLAHQVADAILEAFGHQGFASSRLVMIGNRTGKKELYLVDADGQDVRQLTRDNSVSVAPKWGPNQRIVYTSFVNGYPDVYLINITSGQRTRISNFAGLNTGADLSPDGRQVVLVLSKDGNPELYTKDIRSGTATRVTRTHKAAEASPSWSPDGREIVYVADTTGRPHLYIAGRSGAKPTRISSRGSENVSPDWGANGKIAYCTRQEGRYQIMVYDPATREHAAVPAPAGANYEDPSWAPDGRHIACTRTVNHRSQVYILDTLGDPPVALTNMQGDWHSPSWSP